MLQLATAGVAAITLFLSARSVETSRLGFLEDSMLTAIFRLRKHCLKFIFDQGIGS